MHPGHLSQKSFRQVAVRKVELVNVDRSFWPPNRKGLYSGSNKSKSGQAYGVNRVV